MAVTTEQGGSIGLRLQLLRAARRENQIEMARALGISQKTLSDFERGVSSPRINQLEAACKMWGMTLAEFLSFPLPPSGYSDSGGSRVFLNREPHPVLLAS
jgi:transcriptional regulator with XRE-family HTH domain